MAGLLGKKLGMTQVFGAQGEMIPVTVVHAGPCSVLEVKAERKVLRLGFGETELKKLKKPLQGYFQKLKLPPRKHMREIAFPGSDEYQPGQEITVSLFQPGDYVDVTGRSKGRGFAGVVSHWGASRWPMTHGHPEHRRTGSIGASASPGRVVKGKRMAGRWGGDRITVRNLEVFEVRPEENLIMLKGAVPGPVAGLLVLRKARKKKPAPKPAAPEPSRGKKKEKEPKAKVK